MLKRIQYPSLSEPFAFQVINPVSIFVGQDVMLIFPKSMQYQRLAFVNTVGNSTFPEKVHPEATQIYTELPLANWKNFITNNNFIINIPSLFFTNIFPPIIPVFNININIISIPRVTQYQKITFIPTVIQAEIITVDKWVGQKPDYIFDIKRQQYSFPSSFIDANQLTQPELSTLDKWIGSKPDILFDLKREQFIYPSEFRVDTVIPTQEAINSESYHPDYIFDQKQQQYLYPSSFIDSFQLTQAERITPDKWLGSKPDYIFDLRRQQFTSPSEFRTDILTPISEAISAESYHPDILFDLKRLQYLYPNLFIDTNQLTLPERTTVDKWLGNKPDKLFDLQRNQYLYPSFFIDTLQLTKSEITSIDRWLGSKPDYIFDIKRNQFIFPNLFFSNLGLISPNTIANWKGYYPDFIYDIRRLQIENPTLFQELKIFGILRRPPTGGTASQLSTPTGNTKDFFSKLSGGTANFFSTPIGNTADGKQKPNSGNTTDGLNIPKPGSTYGGE